MKPIQMIAGFAAGAVGAAVWAAIVHFANAEIGYVAWGVGILVGVAVAATGRNSTPAGIGAVLITILALVAGKYAAVELYVQGLQTEIEEAASEWSGLDEEVTAQDLQSFLAHKLVAQREAAGETIEWPEVAENETNLAAFFPADIWAGAVEQLAEKSDEQRAALSNEFVVEAKIMTDDFVEADMKAIREEGFMASFGAFDLIFFGLAIATAWGIASRDEESEEDEEGEESEDATVESYDKL